MRRLLLLPLVLLILGCEHDPEQTKTAGNGVQVDRLFHSNGVTVYRFEDAGRYHYYVVPESGEAATLASTYTVCTGKVCHTYDDTVQTVRRIP